MNSTHQVPVIVGISQYRQDKDAPSPLDPIGMMSISGRKAFADAKISHLPSRCDTVRVINIFSHSYKDAGADLAEAVGCKPDRTFYSPMGGNTPQRYVNEAARDIARGRSRMTLIAGAEAAYALRRAQKGEISLDWPDAEPPRTIDGEDAPGGSDFEYRYDIIAPVYAYAFLENALRAAAGKSLPEHHRSMGSICERLSRAAAVNPYAWIREAADADTLTAPSPRNRMVAFPYTLRMTANLNVDQSAAVVLTSQAYARELGIPEERWVYPMGGAGLHNIWNVVRRPRLFDSAALAASARLAFDQARVRIEEIAFFDLYSCFPSAVEIARRELGISETDPRDISVTGGLPYFGGPGNNYSLHAIAAAADRIRHHPEELGLVTALGWFNTKWAVGIYGAKPGVQPWTDLDVSDIQAKFDGEALAPPTEHAEGKMTIESYTIVCDRFGTPDRATVIGRLAGGSRTFAFLDASQDRLAELMEIELIGKHGTVRFDAESNRNLLRLNE